MSRRDALVVSEQVGYSHRYQHTHSRRDRYAREKRSGHPQRLRVRDEEMMDDMI
jgi:hypothetical protein